MDNTSSTLLTLAVLAGGVASDLLIKSQYVMGLIFLVVTGALVFVREYFKVA